MENKEQYNSFSLLKFLWKWRKLLLVVCLATAILSAICSFFIKPRFKSTATIYAPRTNSMAKILLNEENYNERLDIKAYAIEEETEQMMQLLNAVEIKDSLIKQFDLAKHYEVDMKAKGAMTKLYKALTNNLVIKRTDYGAITITVSDEDPQMACDMTNAVLRLIDTVKNRTERDRAVAAYQALRRQMDSIDREIARLDDSIKVCMEHGVFDVEEQSNRVMQQYAIAVAQGNNAAISRLNEEQAKLATWGPKLDAWHDLQFTFREYQSLCKQKMMDAQLDMQGSLPVKFVVDRPAPADKKYYPKKSLIVVVSTLCVFILSVIVLLMIEKIEEKPTTEPEEAVDRTDA